MSAAPAPGADREAVRTLLRTTYVVASVFVLGTVGYTVIGHPEHGVLDALYMTVITVTTTGFREVIDLTDHPAGQVFTAVLLLVGVGSFLSFFSAMTAFFVEGGFFHVLGKRRMQRHIETLRGHCIVCGGGNTGIHILAELHETRRPFVLIERTPERVHAVRDALGVEIPHVVGDATDDSALQRAGIETASMLVACLSNDKDNLITTLSARLLKPDLRIVSRCVDDQSEKKIRKAGADAVVSVNRIGGLRIVSEAVRPTAVSYLDQMLRGTEEAVRVESTTIAAESPCAGGTLADLTGAIEGKILVLALRDADDAWVYAPDGSSALTEGMHVVYVGSPGIRSQVEAQVATG